MKKEFLSLMEERYSVRSFSNKTVEDEKIEAILHAGQVAPTACNKQPQHIYVLKSKESLETLKKCTYSHFGETLAFIVCYDSNLCWTREFDGKQSGDMDASIVATHMMLEAWELGIGSTWIMHFIPEAIVEEFHLPNTMIPVCILAMGYPSSDSTPSELHRIKKKIKDMVSIL